MYVPSFATIILGVNTLVMIQGAIILVIGIAVLLDAHLRIASGIAILMALFTFQSCPAISRAYNSKSIVEDDFKALKNRLLIPVKPFFHRYDSHMRVHVSICVLSMALYKYMLWRLNGIGLTEQGIIKEIMGMRLAFVKEHGSTSVKRVLERMTPEQIGIYPALDLGRYLPN